MKTELLKLKKETIIKVSKDTQFVLDFPSYTGEYTVELIFEKPGAIAEILGVYLLNEGDSLSLTTVANHRVPNTSCTTSVKGVLNDGAKSDYIGKIIIGKEAQQTSSYLDDSILVVGEATHNNSQPILEIDADDVKASHGATTGRISAEQVYYLQSRGLSKKEAEKVIVKGFFESLLSRVNDPKIREQLLRGLNKDA